MLRHTGKVGMPLRVLRNNGKVFTVGGMPETEKTMSETKIEEKKKKLQGLRRRAALKFSPIPATILSLINKAGNMLQTAGVTPSVTEAKINQLLNQISSMIDSAQGTANTDKNDGRMPVLRGGNFGGAEAMMTSEDASDKLKKRKPDTLLKSMSRQRSRRLN
jgi:hypothetical protein